MLSHGTTLHGAQAQAPQFRCQPLLYYAHETPIGQVFDAERKRKPGLTIGAIGLGTGSVASYVRSTDALTFFEIDPLVVHVSTNPANFSYVSECAKGPIGYVLGDARLTLNKQPNHHFDVLLIDAFSSDSVPAHLLTVEAVKMYLSKLKPDGVVILHLSNRNLDLNSPAEAVAAAAGGHAMIQTHQGDKARPALWESSEDAVIISPTEAGLAPYKDDIRWDPIHPNATRPWTDDYTNLFGALIRRTEQKMRGIY
jgi:SAM-dependent methyltransferase